MTIIVSTTERVKILRKSLLFFLQAYIAVFLIDSLLKKSKFIIKKMKKKDYRFEKS